MTTRKIVIAGGGTAGWMSACLLNHAWMHKGWQIMLVESAEVATVGVGEGSTPALKGFFDKLGIAEDTWMSACHATYKCGISFRGWAGRNGFEEYFHPFPSPIDGNTLGAFSRHIQARRQGIEVPTRPDHFFLSARLAREHRAPIEPETFPFPITYGYHFDAGLLAAFLRQHATQAGVVHHLAHISHINRSDTGNIHSLVTREGQQLEADFFIDCTGFSSLLSQQTLAVPFVSYSDNLFNDAAVALPTPMGTSLPSRTLSTALDHGWAWQIPLTHRFGNGYVYSSRYCDQDEAELELREHLGLLESEVSAHHLTMKVGRLARHWDHNCLAVGLSQGFIEPLEATALMLVQYTVENFILAFEKGNFGNTNQSTFNTTINNLFEGIRDYIVSHYKTTGRKDTDYWRDNGANQFLSDSLRRLFYCWMSGKNVSEEIDRQGIGRFYTDVSWHCLLAGMGVFPAVDKHYQTAPVDMEQIDDFLRRCALNFPDHKEFIIK